MATHDRIRKLMIDHQITGKELAKRTSVSPEHISRILAGSVVPRVDLAIRIAAVLHSSCEYLFAHTLDS
ncbi:MAG: helix-turn-helix transcriptional regulator [Candidatus Desulforudaceae bacterium]